MFYMALDEIEQERLNKELTAPEITKLTGEKLIHKIPGKKNPSVGDLKRYAIDKRFKTRGNKYSDFPVGCKVQVITPAADFRFFNFETGTVIKNSGSYFSIIVKFDNPDEAGTEEWGFCPEHLRRIGN
jgi:hypothetical protein